MNPQKTIKREVPAEERKLLVKSVTLFSTIFFLYSVRVIHDCCQIHPCLAFLLCLDKYYLLNLYAYILITKVIYYNLIQIITSKYQKKGNIEYRATLINRTIAWWRSFRFCFVIWICQSRWGLKNNDLNLHKKTTNSRILVVVVKWRHHAIVVLKKNARTHTHTRAQRKPCLNYYCIYTAFWYLWLTPTIKA